MDALIYTPNDLEYSSMKTIMENEGIKVTRCPLDGHGHYDYMYHIVVVSVEGAQGMEIVRNWTSRYRECQVIWITGDPYFAGIAIESHVHDFIERPYDEARFRQSVLRALKKCSDNRVWHFPGQKN